MLKKKCFKRCKNMLEKMFQSLVTRTHKREHITPVVNSLPWLPVIYRSQYKILMYTFKALQGTAPQYLEELVVPYQPTRSLRSESGAFLAVPTTRGVTYGNRCFRKASATLWNNLPVTIRKCKTLDTFKKKIKTNLFVSAFPSWIYYVFDWKELCIFKDVNLLHPWNYLLSSDSE